MCVVPVILIIFITSGFTVIVLACVVLVGTASVTSSVNEAVPALVGVPEITPTFDTVLSVAQVGKLPADILQVYGRVPPLAVR